MYKNKQELKLPVVSVSSNIDSIILLCKNYIPHILARLITFFTPKSIQIKRIKRLEGKAEKIAIKKKIPFPFRCKIKYQKGDIFHSVGYSNRNEPKIDGKFDIYFYSSYTMLSESEILLTIFHEYGHFIYDFAQPNARKQFALLYFEDKFPILTRGGLIEDFSECFALIIVKNLYLVNKDAANLMENLIAISVLNIEKYDSLNHYEEFCFKERHCLK